MTDIRAILTASAEEKNADFVAKLTPGVPRESILGVRTPRLRAIAKELSGTAEAEAFLHALPHELFEENGLHGLLIELIKDYDRCIAALDEFLPYVDNWATCDVMNPKVFKKHRAELIDKIRLWIADGRTYTVRFGLEMLMTYYLDEAFEPEYLELAANVKSGEYYINMMQAWFFATALAKQYDAALPYIQGNRLDVWSHNKTIQKAVESYRVTDVQKAYLKTLKIK